MIAKNLAPGLNRNFISETWPKIPSKIWAEARDEARNTIYKGEIAPIYASDADAKVIAQAKENAKKAGVAEYIKFSVGDVASNMPKEDYGVMITNPPYGQRIGQQEQLNHIYASLRKMFPKGTTWSAYIITSDEEFEQHFGRKADAKRKLFNGTTKTDYYQYQGPRPPKTAE
jgi:putative N6-adenine-specific DNA methylase